MSIPLTITPSAYDILGVKEEGADDAIIRRAYLDKLQHTSPDHDPNGFEQIKQAYDAIKTHDDRENYAFFCCPAFGLSSLIDEFFSPDKPQRPTSDELKALLKGDSNG